MTRRYPQRAWRGCRIRAPASRVLPRCRPRRARSGSSSPSRSGSTASASGRCLPLGVAPARSTSSSFAHLAATCRRVLRRRSRRAAHRRVRLRLRRSCSTQRPPRARLVARVARRLARLRAVPVPLLGFVLPGARAGSRRSGSPCRCSSSSGSASRAALRAGWQLAPGRLRARARLARDARARLLHLAARARVHPARAGDAGAETRRRASRLVISPLLFVGAALLYVDQAARVE